MPEYGLAAGAIGTVVLIHQDGRGYEVEFVAPDGKTSAVASLFAAQIDPLDRQTSDMSPDSTAPSVFICYAQADNQNSDPAKRWLDRLLESLQPLNERGRIRVWSDRDLEIGGEWHQEIQATLRVVRAAVLLVSPAFLASKYIRNSELPVLLQRAKDQGVVILPVIVRSCLFQEATFKYPDPQSGPQELSLASLQAANSPSQPLNSLPEHEQDQVLLAVARRLLRLVESQNQETAAASSPPPTAATEPTSAQPSSPAAGFQPGWQVTGSTINIHNAPTDSH